MFGNRLTTTTYFGIRINNANASLIARNTTTRSTNGTTTLVVGQWYHIVGVFSTGNNRVLYVNGVQEASDVTNAVTFSTTNPRWLL